MQDPAYPNGVALVITQTKHPRNGLAKLSNALGMPKSLTVPLVDHTALHDVRVA